MRLGFFLGFLIGSSIAAVLARPDTAEAPSSVQAGADDAADTAGLIESAKRRAREAMAAARAAADEKQAEMQDKFESAKHNK